MTDSRSEVPPRGPLPKPAGPDDARLYLRDSAFGAPAVATVTLEGGEFTSICPVSGQPDFGTVAIEYEPDGRCIESRALKYYLWSFRDEPAFCEALAARIADDVVFAVTPRRVRVTLSQNVRGGISILAVAERGD